MSKAILNAVQDQYGAVARSDLSNESAAVRSVAQAFGYSAEDLASLPPQANMGLSCGNVRISIPSDEREADYENDSCL
jgi:hypothetical protein